MSFHERKRLSDILSEHEQDELARQFDESEVAPERIPVPYGRYRCRITDGKRCVSKSGTTGYTLTFTIDEGEHKGRCIWHTCWLTPAAMRFSKRDLKKLGIEKFSMLDAPLPQGFVCDVVVALRQGDDGGERNEVISFEVIGVCEDPSVDPDFGTLRGPHDEEMPF